MWKYYRDEPNDNLSDSESFKSKTKITGKTPNNGNEKDVEIMVPLKYLSNFWRTLEMPLISCEVNFILTWSPTCVINNSTDAERFTKTDTKLYAPIITLLTQDNSKLLRQLKSSFKKAINWNMLYVMINGEKFFDQPIKNNKVTYEKISTDQGDDYTTGCLLDYPYFKDSYKMIAVDICK